MIIETINNETLIRIPSGIDFKIIQSVLDYLRISEILSKNQGSDLDASKLAEEVDKEWWRKNNRNYTNTNNTND